VAIIVASTGNPLARWRWHGVVLAVLDSELNRFTKYSYFLQVSKKM
jgi:hypothetical protein